MKQQTLTSLCRWLVTPVLLAALPVAFLACTNENPESLDAMDRELASLEASLVRRPNDTPCLNYATICERVAAICLWADDPRCDTIAQRCTRNLRTYCDIGTTDSGPTTDAGTPDSRNVGRDAQVGRPDASSDTWHGWPDASSDTWHGWPDAAADTGHGRPDASPVVDASSDDSWVEPDASQCPPQQAIGIGFCKMALGVVFNGNACVTLSGCRCSGRDCHHLYDTVRECQRDNYRCVSGCIRTGCSGQICSDRPRSSTCEMRPEYRCYDTARCERQDDGSCGFTLTDELEQCLDNGGPDDCRTTGCSGNTTCQPCWFEFACLPRGAVC